MIEPEINKLMKNMDSRYTLVIAVAKRARQINDGAQRLTKYHSDKPVTLAIHEIGEKKVNYTRTKNGIK
jgi:DNA-directed RNA polymerase subunit omega